MGRRHSKGLQYIGKFFMENQSTVLGIKEEQLIWHKRDIVHGRCVSRWQERASLHSRTLTRTKNKHIHQSLSMTF